MLYHEAHLCPVAPKLTGIPPHTLILDQNLSLKKEIINLKNQVIASAERYEETLKGELNRRGIGGEVYHANDILDSVRACIAQFTSLMEESRSNMQITPNSSNSYRGGAGGAGAQYSGPLIATGEDGSNRTTYVWGGQFHNIPENFVLPKMNLNTLIYYWFCGSKHPLVPPLKYARSWDFRNPRAMTSVLAQMKKMVSHVLRAATHVRFDLGTNGVDSLDKATRLYEAIIHLFQYGGTKNTRRYTAMTWKTVYLDLQKHKFKFVGEEQSNRVS